MAEEDLDLEARIERLEAEIERLTESLEQRNRAVSLLAADADIDGLEATCPNCGEGTLIKKSGLSYSRLVCRECKTHWDT
jgi:ribosomal protein S27AE